MSGSEKPTARRARCTPASFAVSLSNGDFYEIAAAYAFHVAESQAYFDGNKRTRVQAAADFLDINGIDTSPLPELVL